MVGVGRDQLPALRTGCELVARHSGIDKLGPGVDATLQIAEIAESLTPEVLRGVLTAYAMVALEYNERIRIQAEQRVVMRLVKQTRAVDLCDRALRVRADIDQLERRAALDQCLQLGS